jgi:hypothetical protein
VITNCDAANKMFELFYIDFGNTNIASKDDILYGWREEHVNIFKSYEPQALKCKLYGLYPFNKKSFSETENQIFKERIFDKLLSVKIIKYNDNVEIFEIILYDCNMDNSYKSSIQNYLVSKQLGLILKYFSFYLALF